MKDPKKEHAILEEGHHPEWELEKQTEGLDKLQGERLEPVEAEETEKAKA